MGTEKTSVVEVKKPTLTPKAIIYNKFGSKACYTIEEVQESSPKGCPGLALPQKGPCLYRCCLQLPEFSVISQPCKRKKEAEQSAAEMALEKLGIHPATQNHSMIHAADELVARLSYLFSNEFLSSLQPLSGHLKAVFRRDGELAGSVPVSAMVSCDAKLGNLCKSINPKVESNLFLAIPLVMSAAAKLPELVTVSEEQLWIRRQNPYPAEVIQSISTQLPNSLDRTEVEAVYIPFSLDKAIQPIKLNTCLKGYYLDVIAQELGVADASEVLVSRTIGKASSEMRMYVSALETCNLHSASEFENWKGTVPFDGSFNVRASYLLSQEIYGNAILASAGYTWKSADLFLEDVSLNAYFRMLVSKTPDGLYKLSREAILAAGLPVAFTTKRNWRGSLPRDLLCTFCRQHRLAEPLFNVISNSVESVNDSSRSSKVLKAEESVKVGTKNGDSVTNSEEELIALETFKCEVRVFSKSQDLILECRPKVFFKKQDDAIQNATLRVLLWLNNFFNKQDKGLEELCSSAATFDIQCHLSHLLKKLCLFKLIHNVEKRSDSQSGLMNQENYMSGDQNNCLSIEGPESGSAPSNGSFVCISYQVFFIVEGGEVRHVLESNHEFEFEISSGAVISCIETAAMQMTAGQTVRFCTELPSVELVLAAAVDSSKILSFSNSNCCLEYSVTLLRVTDPLEDRMEQALFSPSLSKQRVEFALQHIRDSCALSLIDFGCGSGSLLDSLIDYPSSLERIIGVDISQKGLIRAAKVLHSKLDKLEAIVPTSGLKSATLYEGSITVFDSRLYGFDIGTCLEVIEHMEEDQACLFGDIALGLFRPRILVVSTPNYEYNVILQRSNLLRQEEDPEEKSKSQPCKFRNHDHKFEWTREQFNRWAADLALRHSYTVEFGGVGGSPGVEPGFASQIAVFRRLPQQQQHSEDCRRIEMERRYEVIWEWNAAKVSESAH